MLTINMDKKCAECRKPGAANSGICLRCVGKIMRGQPMKSAEGRAVAAIINAGLRNLK